MKIIFSVLFQIFGRLFSDSGPRRSTRVAGESKAKSNASTTAAAGNGTTNLSKYLGGSKLSSVALHSKYLGDSKLSSVALHSAM